MGYIHLIHASCYNAVWADGYVGGLVWVENVLVTQRNRKNVKVFKQPSDADCLVKRHVLFTHGDITSQRDDGSIIAVLRLKQEIIQNMFKCVHNTEVGPTLILRTGSSS